jgi:hypothetical protein|tara:strand:- start:59 stop:220 length:162 start_codon:yes stop_codon:yes gene_type:complete
MKQSKSVREFILNGGTIKVIDPAKTLKKYQRQYKKDRSVMGPSKSQGHMGKAA